MTEITTITYHNDESAIVEINTSYLGSFDIFIGAQNHNQALKIEAQESQLIDICNSLLYYIEKNGLIGEIDFEQCKCKTKMA